MFTVKKVPIEKRLERGYLEQTSGQGAGRTFELSRDVLSIGRSEDNEIVMKSDSVSRCHAFLRRQDNGDWLFQDNQSKNGIRTNGKKVREARLEAGDILGIGEFTFRFHPGAAPPSIEKPERTAVVELTRPSVLDRWQMRYQLLKVWFTGQRPKVQAGLNQLRGHVESNLWGIGVGVVAVLMVGILWKVTRAKVTPPVRGTAQVVPEVPPKAEPTPPEQTASRTPRKTGKVPMGPAPKADDSRPTNKKDIRDLQGYLSQGAEYLKEGDLEAAAIAFRFALVIDPNDKQALEGLKAAGQSTEARVPSRAKAPKTATRRPEKKKPSAREKKARELAGQKEKVAELLQRAREAAGQRRFTLAIERAEAARQIEIPDHTEYLNEAKQIIDQSRIKQKELFEPFLEEALKKLDQGDYSGSSSLCEQMLRIDPDYAPAVECLTRSVEAIAGQGVR